ncbi:hypothetical protein [Shewanella maritima]|uniref:hypothetical protein n=1 Tax=Shewanella maritima TaxID=2520507 RepID=UPI003736D487
MKKQLSKYIAGLSVVILSACSMSPPQLQPNVALVTAQTKFEHYQKVPQQLWSQLDSAVVGSHFAYNNHTIEATKKYHSALGTACLQLSVHKTEIQDENKHLVCQNAEEQWFLVPQIMDKETSHFFAN